MSIREMWRQTFAVNGRVPGRGDQPSRKWLKGYRKLRLAPNDPMQTGVLYSGHTGQRDCPCPYCPTELEQLEASGHPAPERRVVTADEAAGLGLAVHRYLSTGCLHGEHGYCQSNTGSNGTKTPASCKFCGAGCECSCHGEDGDG